MADVCQTPTFYMQCTANSRCIMNMWDTFDYTSLHWPCQCTNMLPVACNIEAMSTATNLCGARGLCSRVLPFHTCTLFASRGLEDSMMVGRYLCVCTLKQNMPFIFLQHAFRARKRYVYVQGCDALHPNRAQFRRRGLSWRKQLACSKISRLRIVRLPH